MVLVGVFVFARCMICLAAERIYVCCELLTAVYICEQQALHFNTLFQKRLGAFGPKNIQETLQVSMGKECIEVSTANELIKLVTER